MKTALHLLLCLNVLGVGFGVNRIAQAITETHKPPVCFKVVPPAKPGLSA